MSSLKVITQPGPGHLREEFMRVVADHVMPLCSHCGAALVYPPFHSMVLLGGGAGWGSVGRSPWCQARALAFISAPSRTRVPHTPERVASRGESLSFGGVVLSSGNGRDRDGSSVERPTTRCHARS